MAAAKRAAGVDLTELESQALREYPNADRYLAEAVETTIEA